MFVSINRKISVPEHDLMKASVLTFIAMLFTLVLANSCRGGQDSVETFDVDFVLPASADMLENGTFTFQVKDGKAPLTSDVIVLESSGTGISYVCPVVSSSSTEFTVQVASGIPEGSYTVYVKRGNEKKPCGTIYIRIIEDIGFIPDEGFNVYGQVRCGDEGVAGVVVSDGAEVAVTDESGYYQLASEKGQGTVFMSVPSGYEALSDGIVPQFFGKLAGSSEDVEQINFNLVKSDNQDYTLLAFGDMHLADRSNTHDRTQFRRFTDDLNEFRAANPGRKIYALTLGDMTWDLYWIDNSYAFPEYIEDMNEFIEGDLQVYHTIGNHDHSMDGVGDFSKTSQYRTYLGPEYYSFNIGNYHYVVLDDIDFMENISDRDNYVEDVSSAQLEWLSKDLEHVGTDTPVILATHAPLYKDNSLNPEYRLVNAAQLVAALEGRKVHILTGHTHRMLNVDKIGSADAGHFEHNAGAVCADWWWSYTESGIHISTDGAPGGYSVFEISGDDIRWRYKATDFSDSYQFRTYDLNNVNITYDYVSNADDDHKATFAKYVSAYPANSDNEVLVNIWNWDPEWSLSVTEDGRELGWEQVVAYDPLHIIAYTAKRLDKNSTATFPTQRNNHFFKVRASSPSSTLTIKVTDRFGNTFTEEMERPKAFDISTYLDE